jgi:hypothetical protein
MPRILNKKYWPYEIELPKLDKSNEMETFKARRKWLKENCQSEKDYVIIGDRYVFKHEFEATLFALRWA